MLDMAFMVCIKTCAATSIQALPQKVAKGLDVDVISCTMVYLYVNNRSICHVTSPPGMYIF